MPRAFRCAIPGCVNPQPSDEEPQFCDDHAIDFEEDDGLTESQDAYFSELLIMADRDQLPQEMDDVSSDSYGDDF